VPFEINEIAFRKALEINMGRPQETVSDPVPDNFSGTLNRGLPVRQIPHREYPRVVYMHPTRPHKEVVHRNAQHEIVEVEKVPTEHISKLVQNEEELQAALKEGWRKEAYVAPVVPDPDADLYGPTKAKQEPGKK
jgi:hypothetical protein